MRTAVRARLAWLRRSTAGVDGEVTDGAALAMNALTERYAGISLI
jgi:hypothetical protein